MKSVNTCIVCGREFEADSRVKLCSPECKATRKLQYKKKAVVVEPKRVEEVVETVTETKTVTKTQPESKEELKADTKWVLTVKDMSKKTFKNIVFFTPDVTVAHKFIDDMRKAKVLSFISLADTERIEKYLLTGEITKKFKGNLSALTARKVPMDAKNMYTEVFNAIKSAQSEQETMEVEVIAPEPVSTTVA